MTVIGCDVSSWQGNINWDIAATKIQFAILRASHGKNADPYFARNVAECQRVGLPWGAYHYSVPSAGLSWQVQADFFLSLVHDNPPLWCWLDAEDAGGLDKVALESWYFKFVKRLETNGLTCGIYTSPGFWNAHLALTNWAKAKPLWVAHWTSADKPLQPLEWTPKANPTGYPYTFWQWSADKNGKGKEHGMESTDLDLDRFNGNEAKFNQQFGTNIQPLPAPPPPPPPPSGEVVVVAQGWANLRAIPDIKGADIGNLLKGSTFTPVGESGNWYEVHGFVSKTTVKKA